MDRMTKLPPSDSFLPSGAADFEMTAAPSYSGKPPSILSPISKAPAPAAAAAPAGSIPGWSSSLSPRLPIGASAQASNPPPTFHPDFAYRAAAPHSPQPPFPSISSPLPPAIPAPTAREPLPAFTFPPPALSPGPFHPYSRGLSPDNYSMFRGPASPGPFSSSHLMAAAATDPMNHLLSGMDASASVSGAFAVAGAAPPQPSTHLIQRLSQQNILIRDAWEAERNYLEANRRRAEEVYQEERAIMEDLRDVWSHEKLELLQAMQLLRERIQRLEGENTALKAMVSQSMPSVTGVLSPLASQRGDSANGSASHSLSGSPVPANGTASSVQQGSSQKHANFNSSASVISASLPPGLDGASRRPHFASPPKQQPSPPLVMDPRTQPETSPAHDFLAAPSNEAEAPVAVIDVQEIDPKLEGISLKATAIQKPTFSQEIAKSPPVATSPEAGSHHEDDGELSESQQLGQDSSTGRTRQVLAAEPSRRRTMHAGHTPIHSISVFPTMTTATGASSLGARSGDTTPTGAAPSPPPEPEEYLLAAADDAPEVCGDPGVVPGEASLPECAPAEMESDLDDSLLQANDDPPLKGPLMVKNIPAQDELFWAAVNKKLEPISQGQDALPTVMQTPPAELDLSKWPDVLAVVGGGDANRTARAGDQDDDDLDDELDSSGKKASQEIDIPLKLRTTTNFGAPFGRM